MRHSNSASNPTPQQDAKPTFIKGLLQSFCVCAVLVLASLTLPPAAAQTQTTPPAKRAATPQAGKKGPATAAKPAAKKPKADDMAWLQDAVKDPDLMKEVNHLSERLLAETHYPTPRTQSALLARLPQSTALYGAVPNFGPQIHQAVQIFHEELQTSTPLRSFLEKNKLLDGEAKFEDGVQMFFDFSEYLGDEFVVIGEVNGKEPSFALVASIKKPGVKAFLENMDRHLSGTTNSHLQILEPQQLASATDSGKTEPVVLVRPDVLVLGFKLASLRDLNAQLDQGGATFASSGLGKRLAKSYEAGTTTIFGADLQKLFTLIPSTQMQASMMLDKTGFGDAQYAIMASNMQGKSSTSNMELLFSGPRHGVASWLASPAALGSLDFVPAKSSLAEVFRLKNPAQMLDDIIEIAGPQASAMLPQMEAKMNINLKQDLLSKLTGEIGLQFDVSPLAAAASGGKNNATPNFTVLVGVSDPTGLQQTIKRLLAQAPMQSGERQTDNITLNTLTIPGARGNTQEVNYFFLDGYLVVATSREGAESALRAHRDGSSMAKSGKLGKAGAPVASSVIYQNLGSFLSMMGAQAPPEIRQLLSKSLDTSEPSANVFYAYADENRIRATTNSVASTDASIALIGAAIAIPNLLRLRNGGRMNPRREALCAPSTRPRSPINLPIPVTVTRPAWPRWDRLLGSDCSDNEDITAAHACLLDGVLGNASCTSGKWCTKNGYRYSVRGICGQTSCRGYVVTATPVSTGTGTKSFCSVNDTVVRTQTGAPLETPLTVAECKAWRPIQ